MSRFRSSKKGLGLAHSGRKPSCIWWANLEFRCQARNGQTLCMLETCKYCMVMRYQYLTENIPLANHLVMLYSWVCHIKLLNSLLICSSIRMNSSINQSTSRKCVDLIRQQSMHHQGTWSYRPSHHHVLAYIDVHDPNPCRVVEAHFQLATPLSSNQHTIILRTIFSARKESAISWSVQRSPSHVPLQGPTHWPSRLHVGSMQEVLHVRVPGRVQGVTSQKSAKKNQLDAPSILPCEKPDFLTTSHKKKPKT